VLGRLGRLGQLGQQAVLPGEGRVGPGPQLGSGEECLDALGVPGRQVRLEVAQPEVVAGRAVHDPEQADDGVERELQVERHRLRELTTRDRPVDQPGRRGAPGGDLRDGLAALALHRFLVIGSQLDQAVGIVEHQRLAVPARVDEAVVVREVGDVEVDDPGRNTEVAGIRGQVEERLATVGPGRLGQLPHGVHLEVAARGLEQSLVRRHGLARRRQHLDIEVGVLVVAAGDRRAADEHDPDGAIALAPPPEPRHPVVVPAEIAHAAEPRVTRKRGPARFGYDGCHAAPPGHPAPSTAALTSSHVARPPLPARGFFLPENSRPGSNSEAKAKNDE
jgi:hypothetical protein